MRDNTTKQGRRLEGAAAEFLEMAGYTFIDDPKIKRMVASEGVENALDTLKRLKGKAPMYVGQTNACFSIYGVPWKIDFLVYHPDLFPEGLLVEVKQQSAPGSVDEKYPFVIMSLQNNTPAKGLIFMGGGAIRDCVRDWCLSQESDDLFVATNEREFREIITRGRKTLRQSRNHSE